MVLGEKLRQIGSRPHTDSHVMI